MRYIIDMAIFGPLPDYTRVVLVARQLDNTQNAAAGRNMLRKAAQAAGLIFENQASTNHPHFTPWQLAYEAFGITDVLSGKAEGPEKQGIPALLHLRTEDTPLTNILNAFALQNLLPVGGDDLDRVAGNVWLRPARGNELFIPAGHPERPESPDIGEIVCVDDGPYVLRRRWHGRQGDTARLTSQTRNALIYLDCLPPINRAKAEELAGKLTRLVAGFFGAQVETHFLTREQPAIEIQL
jgi:DNA/RNA-binding domain of Phe-tRNA-synthetase-like protein